jgi:hypothetical protein
VNIDKSQLTVTAYFGVPVGWSKEFNNLNATLSPLRVELWKLFPQSLLEPDGAGDCYPTLKIILRLHPMYEGTIPKIQEYLSHFGIKPFNA